MLALSWKADSCMQWKRDFFSLVLPGKWGAEQQERHHMTHLNLIQKLQRTPIWNWHNCHPIAGTSEKGKIELPAPMLHHLLKSALSSDFASTTRVQARMAQNGGRSTLLEWGSRDPQGSTLNLELRVTLVQNILLMNFFSKMLIHNTSWLSNITYKSNLSLVYL